MQQLHEKILSITNHQGNINQNMITYETLPCYLAITKKTRNNQELMRIWRKGNPHTVFKENFIYLFLAHAGSLLLHGLFSSQGEQGLLSTQGVQAPHCSGCPCRGAQVQQLWCMGLVALWHVGSSQTRDLICLLYLQVDSLLLSHQGSSKCIVGGNINQHNYYGKQHAAKSLQLCLTLRNSMDCSLPGSSVHGIFQARVLEWGAIAFSKESSIEAPQKIKNANTI